MSNCELIVHFDRPDPTYHFGETVSGVVEVRADKSDCRGLSVAWGWHTHGRGDRESSLKDVQVLFRGRWEPGPVYRYPFQFDAPNGPETYHGEYLNLDWYVRAQADLGWMRKKRDELDFILIAPPRAEGEREQLSCNQGAKFQAPEPVEDEINLGIRPLIAIAVVLAVGLWWFATGLSVVQGHNSGALVVSMSILAWAEMGLVVGSVVAAFGLWGIYWGINYYRLGRILIEIRPVVVHRGCAIEYLVSIPASADGTHVEVLAFLKCLERAKESVGTSGEKTHEYLAYQKDAPLVLRPSPVGDRITFGESFIIPEDVPLTFSASRNEVKWRTGVRIRVRNLPARKKSYSVAVCP